MTILIAGAGVVGLLTAQRLRAAGHSVELWESSSQVGGWVQSKTINGLPIDLGPQGLLVTPKSATDTLLKKYNLKWSVPKQNERWIGLHGSLRKIPQSPSAFFSSDLISLGGKLRLLRGLCFSKSYNPKSLSSLVGDILGEEIAHNILPALIRGILAVDPTELDPRAVPSIHTLLSSGNPLMKAILRSPRGQFMIPSDGMSSFIDKLAHGLPIEINTPLIKLIKHQHQWTAISPSSSKVFEKVFLCVPAFKAAEILQHEVPDVASLFREIPYTSMGLFYSKHQVIPKFKRTLGFLLHPSESPTVLGALNITPQSQVDSSLYLRTFVSSDSQNSWIPVQKILQQWLPTLSEAQATHFEPISMGIPKPTAAFFIALRQLQDLMPQGVAWLNSANVGPGVNDIIQNLTTTINPSTALMSE